MNRTSGQSSIKTLEVLLVYLICTGRGSCTMAKETIAIVLRALRRQ